jgi:hypothetical protein
MEQLKETPSLISVDDLIQLDVHRTASSMPGVDLEQLKNVLKAFALHSPSVGYSQGMNFVGGVLVAVFRSGEVAFKALTQIADQFDFVSLLSPELPRLNLLFLQLERLLALYDPELATHLSNEGITASYYAPAWFITLFSSSIDQIVNDNQLN